MKEIIAQLEVLDIELTADISDAIKAVDAAKAILLERQAHRDDLYAQHSAISAAIAELRAFDDSGGLLLSRVLGSIGCHDASLPE